MFIIDGKHVSFQSGDKSCITADLNRCIPIFTCLDSIINQCFAIWKPIFIQILDHVIPGVTILGNIYVNLLHRTVIIFDTKMQLIVFAVFHNKRVSRKKDRRPDKRPRFIAAITVIEQIRKPARYILNLFSILKYHVAFMIITIFQIQSIRLISQRRHHIIHFIHQFPGGICSLRNRKRLFFFYLCPVWLHRNIFHRERGIAAIDGMDLILAPNPVSLKQ